MAIFPYVLPSTRHFGDYQDATAMQWNIHLRSSGWSPIQGFLQWKSWYFWWGSFPFVQLKSGIQRFDQNTISEFGFTLRGLLEIYVKDSSYKGIKENDIGVESMGFFLSARDVWLHVLQDLDHGEICCVLKSKLITPLLTFKDLENQSCWNTGVNGLRFNFGLTY